MQASVAPPASGRARGLVQADFRPVARGGLGDPHNSYPHALTWFNDRLYVSTTRDNLVLVGARYPFEIPLAAWPVRLPKDLWKETDLRAQIWRYDPGGDSWTRVFVSPLTASRDGLQLPLTIAFRVMAVFQGRSDPAPALYVPTLPPGRLGLETGSVMIRTFDGESFENCGEIGSGMSQMQFRGFRALQPFRDSLFTAPVMGAKPGTPNVAGAALVFVSVDPGRGTWELANEPNFGDPNNIGVFEMGVTREFLYAGVVNLVEGFQLWKTDADGRPPFRWTRVLRQGAFRGRLNQGAVAMTAFGEHLYVTAAIQGGGYDRANNVGPAAAELLRVAPDDTWDLIAGDARSTPQGFKVPLSGFGAGFGNPLAGYFWRMCAHEGWLYVGTLDTSVFLTWHRGFENLPPHVRNILDPRTLETLMQRFSGFDLWRTADGVRWVPVTTNGFGNRFNYGVRTMASTPHGLFVGATNPFGPEIAVRRAGGWRYEANERGGAEIWLGAVAAPEPSETAPALTRLPRTVQPSGDAGDGSGPVEALVREYYGRSGFCHVGLWRGAIANATQACENLVEELLSLLPERNGTIVDVGCGRGATTVHLQRHYPTTALTGVCASRAELRECREAAPQIRFVSGLPKLGLPDESADALICVEGIAALPDKKAALREMLRVLRPGGRLVMADYVPARTGDDGAPAGDADAAVVAREQLERLGFVEVTVVDATSDCWTRLNQHRAMYLGIRVASQQIDAALVEPVLEAFPGGRAGISAYLIVAATRAPLSAPSPD